MQCSPWRVLQTSAQRQSSAECVSLTGQMSDTRWKESFFVLAAHTEVGGMEGEGLAEWDRLIFGTKYDCDFNTNSDLFLI